MYEHTCHLSAMCTIAACVTTFTYRVCSNYSPTLWSSLTGVNVEINPCRVRTDDALLFYGFAAREAITQPLNLIDARYNKL